MNQAILISINLCNLKFFNEIYGTDEGVKTIAYIQKDACSCIHNTNQNHIP